MMCFLYISFMHYNECFCCFMLNSFERRVFTIMAVIGLSVLCLTEIMDRTTSHYTLRCIFALVAMSTIITTFCLLDIEDKSQAIWHQKLFAPGLCSILALIIALCPVSLTVFTLACVLILYMFRSRYLIPLTISHNTEFFQMDTIWSDRCGCSMHKEYLVQWWYFVFITVVLGAYYNCQSRYPTYVGGILLLWTVVGLCVIFLRSTADEPFPKSRTFFVKDDGVA